MIEFGEKLKSLRESKGITQQTLADQLYVTRQAVSRWECGARYPDLLTAKRIAQALDTTIDELVSGSKIMVSKRVFNVADILYFLSFTASLSLFSIPLK